MSRVAAQMLTALGLTLLLGCPSAETFCRSGVDQVCERVHECQPASEKSTTQFVAQFGTNVNDCKQKLYQNPGAPQGLQGIACDDVQNEQQLCANLGQSDRSRFSQNNAFLCREFRADMTCTEYLAQLADPSQAPEVCRERCSP
jgi:hypothetical protein